MSCILIQQSARAYPRASRQSELNYLKSVLRLYFEPNTKFDRYVEREYYNRTKKTTDMLAIGYDMCSDIKAANRRGVRGQTLLAQEIDKIDGQTISTSGITVTKKKLTKLYKSTTKYLCPELN
ncbi:MAG: hypothetical protein AAGF83_24740 [Cyanobacteria bacterium P01_G01_bin.67]